MKHHLLGKSALAIAAMLSIATAQAAETITASHGDYACSNSESWVFSGSIREAYRADFKTFLRGGMAPVRGFSEALSLRRFAQTPEAKMMGEYWISRALFESNLMHIAHNGFASILSRPATVETAGIQLSALECMVQIQHKHPALALPEVALKKISELQTLAANSPKSREAIWQAAGLALRQEMEEKNSPNLDVYAEMLRGGGAYEEFGFGLRAARTNDHKAAVTHLEKFLARPSLPISLKRYVNTANVLLAREFYATQQFDRASAQLKRVTKSSNELANALSELSWAFLMNDRLGEAIGAAVNLQAGGLRHTYAPEAPMVMAMALNELCQYPESVHAINTFRKTYEKPYRWLKTSNMDNLYPLAVKFVKKTPGLDVPTQIASEWVRTPLFISSQDELNLLFDERDSTTKLGRSGATEQTKIANALLAKAKPLPMRLKAAKKKMKPGDSLPSLLLEDLAALKDMIVRYRRMQQGAPVWHTILANYRKNVPKMEKKLVAGINDDLKVRSQRMIAQLDEIAENIQLIEVEIYNGASQDIIWQNAHPEYKKIAQEIKEEKTGGSAQNWDWGRAPADEDGGVEVWEDELGSFNANIYDNCNSKDKFLALKGRRH